MVPSVFPNVFFTFSGDGKQHTFSPGYTFGLSLLKQMAPRTKMGLRAFFQNDTQGDAISNISLTIGWELLNYNYK